MTWHALSLGAGVNSTALLHVLIDNKMPLDEVIFADTGAEKPETYAYLEKWITPYLAEKGVPYTVVRAKETLQDRCWRGHTIPDRRYRWSTRDYKIRPIYRHLKPHAPVVCYLGICSDEPDRVKGELRVKWLTRKWPLIEQGISRAGCGKIITDHGWPVPVKSGCFFCPFTKLEDWRWLWKEHPDLYKYAVDLEQNGSKYPEFTLYGKRPGVRGTAGLEMLADRFRKEKTAELQQATLDEECEGFCMT